MTSLALDAYTGPTQERTVEQYRISGNIHAKHNCLFDESFVRVFHRRAVMIFIANQMQLWLNVFAVGIVTVGNPSLLLLSLLLLLVVLMPMISELVYP